MAEVNRPYHVSIRTNPDVVVSRSWPERRCRAGSEMPFCAAVTTEDTCIITRQVSYTT